MYGQRSYHISNDIKFKFCRTHGSTLAHAIPNEPKSIVKPLDASAQGPSDEWTHAIPSQPLGCSNNDNWDDFEKDPPFLNAPTNEMTSASNSDQLTSDDFAAGELDSNQSIAFVQSHYVNTTNDCSHFNFNTKRPKLCMLKTCLRKRRNAVSYRDGTYVVGLDDLKTLKQISHKMTLANTWDNLVRFSRNPLVQLVLTKGPQHLKVDIPEPHPLGGLWEDEFYTSAIHIRNTYYPLNATPYFTAQDGSFGDIFGTIFGKVKDLLTTTSKFALDTLKKFVKVVIDHFSGLLSWVDTRISRLINSVLDRLLTWFVERLDIQGFISTAITGADAKKKAVYLSTVLFLILLVLNICAILTIVGVTVLVSHFIKYLSGLTGNHYEIEEETVGDFAFSAQSPRNPTSAITSIAIIVTVMFGLTAKETESVVKRMRDLSFLVAGGTALGSFALALLFFLPSGIKDAMTVRFGSDESKDEIILHDWIVKATAVSKLSKIPQVLVSEEYYKLVNELLEQSNALIHQIKSPTFSQIFVRHVTNLTMTSSTLEQHRLAGSSRRMPFSLHISAPPGVGKTLFVSKLIKDITGLPENQIYSRPIDDDFWSGFIGQKAVILDEFLIGDDQMRTQRAREYLGLISTLTFKPNLASTDSPSVGIKGTIGAPDIAVSISNSVYPSVKGIDDDALQRRRHKVLTLNAVETYFTKSENKLDLSTLSEEELASCTWLTIDMVPVTSKSKAKPIKGLTYPQLVHVLKIEYEAHLALSDKIMSNLGHTTANAMDPAEKIQDSLRNLRGIPNTEISFVDSIKNLLGDSLDIFSMARTWFAQGDEPIPSTSRRMDESDVSGMASPPLVDHGSDDSELNSEIKTWVFGSVDDLISPSTPVTTPTPPPPPPDTPAAPHALSIIDDDSLGPHYVPHLKGKLPHHLRILQSQEISAALDHSNVDCRYLHRHTCPGCTSVIAHQHGIKDIGHSVRCSNCKKKSPFKGTTFKMVSPTEPFQGFMTGPRQVAFDDPKRESWLRNSLKGHIPQKPELAFFHTLRCPELSPENRNALHAVWIGLALEKVRTYAEIEMFMDPSGENCISANQILKQQLHNTALFLAVFIPIFVSVIMISRLFTSDTQEPITFKSQSGPPTKVTKTPARKGKKWGRGFVEQSPTTPATLTFCNKTIKVIPLKDNIILSYLHGFLIDGEMMSDGTPCRLNYNGKAHNFKFHSNLTITCPDSDMILMTIPSSAKVNNFPNIVNQFITSENFIAWRGGLVHLSATNGEIYANSSLIDDVGYAVKDSQYVRLDTALVYGAQTVCGDCGSTVTICSGPLNGKIIGMHVAGSEKTCQGMAVIITRDDIEDAIAEFNVLPTPVQDSFTSQSGPTYVENGDHSDGHIRLDMVQGPNLDWKKPVELEQQIHISRKTKIEPSVISKHLSWKPQKKTPILSVNDSRAEGEDPVLNMINDGLDVGKANPCNNTLDQIFESMENEYENKLVWPVGKRNLTFDEACAGIPGLLASIKTSSSCGWPLVYSRRAQGKKDFIWFDDKGDFQHSKQFRVMVDDFLVKLDEGKLDESRFLGYLKDELISPSKERQKRTRVIYCGDLVATVALRMRFGAILVAINESRDNIPSAVGYNQYSYDMDKIYNYLKKVGDKYIAGDYKNFDKRIVKEIQMRSYNMVMNWAVWTSKEARIATVQHQVESPAQILNLLFKMSHTHYSGCFFTTLINNLSGEAYARYVFAKQCPRLVFKQHFRLKVLGDDHIFCLSDEAAKYINPITIRDLLASDLNQVYTSADKDAELTPAFITFDQTTFLGARPVKIGNRYCGALEKKRLQEVFHWTKDKDLNLIQKNTQMLELASVWEKDYYDNLCNEVNQALEKVNIEKIVMPGWREMRNVVAARTTDSEGGFCTNFVSQGPTPKPTDLAVAPIMAAASPTPADSTLPSALSSFSSAKVVSSRLPYTSAHSSNLARFALNEKPMSLDFGPNSFVKRTAVEWKVDDPAGKNLLAINVPFGLLALGEEDNTQNMPFNNFTYWNGDVAVRFMLNGTPFQAGKLIAYFQPLASFPTELANTISSSNVLSLKPRMNSIEDMLIPFRFYRSAMSTFIEGTESLGTLYLVVMSPLTAPDAEPVTVTISSSFPNSDFTIPRPLAIEGYTPKFHNAYGTTAPVEELGYPRHSISRKKFSAHARRLVFHSTDLRYSENAKKLGIFEAQGASYSTTNQHISISNTGGDMPVQGISAGSEATQQTTVDAAIDMPMPLDNPPLCSGAIPTHPVFSGLAKSNGVVPTVDMQLKPSALNRQHFTEFGAGETSIHSLAARDCLLTRFKWNKQDSSGKQLFELPLNTRFGLAEGDGIPMNVALLNQFMYWHADVVLTFEAVRTGFHSGRLIAVTAYGAPALSVESESVNYTQILDFNEEHDTNIVKITYNAQQEFLRTYEGEKVKDPVQNYSLGFLSCFINNRLVAPDTVSPVIEVLVKIHFENVKVAVPRGNSPFTFDELGKLASPLRGPPWNASGVLFGTIPIGQTTRLALTTFPLVISSDESFPITVPTDSFKLKYNNIEYKNNRRIGLSVTRVSLTSVTYNVTVNNRDFTPPIPVVNQGDITVEVIFFYVPKFSAQGPEEEEEVVVTTVTEERPTERENVPCRLEIGSKFEYCVEAVEEVVRRGVRFNPTTDLIYGQFLTTTEVVSDNDQDSKIVRNFSVTPKSVFSALFAAWAGSYRFRVYLNSEQMVSVVFSPFVSSDGVNFPVPVIDAFGNSEFLNGTEVISSDSFVSGPLAREVLMPLPGNNWIDISCPFQSHFNYHLVRKSLASDDTPTFSGTVSIVQERTDTPANITTFASAGDDFRFGIYRAPQKITLDLSVYFKGTGGFYN